MYFFVSVLFIKFLLNALQSQMLTFSGKSLCVNITKLFVDPFPSLSSDTACSSCVFTRSRANYQSLLNVSFLLSPPQQVFVTVAAAVKNGSKIVLHPRVIHRCDWSHLVRTRCQPNIPKNTPQLQLSMCKTCVYSLLWSKIMFVE